MKATNSGSEPLSTHSGDRIIFWQTLNNPQHGRKYLSIALNTENEQIFLKALHNVMDAIVWELESTN
jgi:hypothetical protein